jgi:2,4-dienoyl-CoA reductase-like NADH-dependent reductase (Old Yellow Enzyme family)
VFELSNLFEEVTIKGLKLRNRIIRSATTSAWSRPDGVLRQEIIDLLSKLASGEVGLIIKGHLYVLDSGKAFVGQAGISNDDHIPILKKLTESIHNNGGVIAAQLSHAGLNSSLNRVGPSDYVGSTGSLERVTGNALTSDEIWKIVFAFGDGAERALEAGFDAIQIHGAHGWLISEFLSKTFNRRDDEWGGDLERRMKILREVIDEIKKRVRVPLFLKINCDDFIPNSFTLEDSKYVSKELSSRGIDLLEISGGSYLGQKKGLRENARIKDDPILSEAYYAGYASEIKKVVGDTKTALVGGIRNRACMDRIIECKIADMISMCRPFIKEQDLTSKLKAGKTGADCTSCNRHSEIMRKMMLHCPLDC